MKQRMQSSGLTKRERLRESVCLIIETFIIHTTTMTRGTYEMDERDESNKTWEEKEERENK